MSFKFTIDVERSFACIERSGKLSAAGMFSDFEKFAKHPDFLKIDKILSILHNTSFSEASEEIAHLAKKGKPFFKGRSVKIAFLVSQDVMFGLASMFGAMFGEDRVLVFREKDKALEWLQVEQ